MNQPAGPCTAASLPPWQGVSTPAEGQNFRDLTAIVCGWRAESHDNHMAACCLQGKSQLPEQTQLGPYREANLRVSLRAGAGDSLGGISGPLSAAPGPLGNAGGLCIPCPLALALVRPYKCSILERQRTGIETTDARVACQYLGISCISPVIQLKLH